MTVKEILAQLKSLGDDARRKHNTKAGAPDNQFGVKLGDLRAMAKKIKTDHELALKLWDTGNVEAQLLATLIIKLQSLSADELDKLTRSTTCAQVAEWLNSYVVAQHPEKESLRERWMKAKDRWAARAGWHLTASRVNKDADGLDLVALLDRCSGERGGGTADFAGGERVRCGAEEGCGELLHHHFLPEAAAVGVEVARHGTEQAEDAPQVLGPAVVDALRAEHFGVIHVAAAEPRQHWLVADREL